MSRTVPAPQDRRPSSANSPLRGPVSHRPRPLDVFVLSAWCGLAAGLLEVAVRVSWRLIHPGHSLYLMSRHFVWSAPLANLLLFSVAGLFLGGATRLWPRRGGWFSLRLIGFFAVLPAISLSSAGIYPLARVLLALGIAMVLARSLERHPTGLRRRMLWSFPALLAVVAASAGSVFGGDWLKQGTGSPTSAAAGRFPQRAPGRAGHREGGSLEPVRLRAPRVPTSGAWPNWESGSTRRGRRHPGRSHRTPASSPAYGPTSSPWTG